MKQSQVSTSGKKHQYTCPTSYTVPGVWLASVPGSLFITGRREPGNEVRVWLTLTISYTYDFISQTTAANLGHIYIHVVHMQQE